MAVSSTSAPSALFTSLNAGAPSRTPAPPGNTLGQADFLKLLMAQMQNQDPLNPVSGTDFTSQLAQFSSLQGIQQLNTNFASLLLLQGLTQGTSLIGRSVTYTKPGATLTSTGTVSAVNVANGNIQLVIGGQNVALSQVQSVTAGKTGS